eukprot:6190822-Pleurochrysis_carterae.AAC.2
MLNVLTLASGRSAARPHGHAQPKLTSVSPQLSHRHPTAIAGQMRSRTAELRRDRRARGADRKWRRTDAQQHSFVL